MPVLKSSRTKNKISQTPKATKSLLQKVNEKRDKTSVPNILKDLLNKINKDNKAYIKGEFDKASKSNKDNSKDIIDLNKSLSLVQKQQDKMFQWLLKQSKFNNKLSKSDSGDVNQTNNVTNNITVSNSTEQPMTKDLVVFAQSNSLTKASNKLQQENNKQLSVLVNSYKKQNQKKSNDYRLHGSPHISNSNTLHNQKINGKSAKGNPIYSSSYKYANFNKKQQQSNNTSNNTNPINNQATKANQVKNNISQNKFTKTLGTLTKNIGDFVKYNAKYMLQLGKNIFDKLKSSMSTFWDYLTQENPLYHVISEGFKMFPNMMTKWDKFKFRLDRIGNRRKSNQENGVKESALKSGYENAKLLLGFNKQPDLKGLPNKIPQAYGNQGINPYAQQTYNTNPLITNTTPTLNKPNHTNPQTKMITNFFGKGKVPLLKGMRSIMTVTLSPLKKIMMLLQTMKASQKMKGMMDWAKDKLGLGGDDGLGLDDLDLGGKKNKGGYRTNRKGARTRYNRMKGRGGWGSKLGGLFGKGAGAEALGASKSGGFLSKLSGLGKGLLSKGGNAISGIANFGKGLLPDLPSLLSSNKLAGAKLAAKGIGKSIPFLAAGATIGTGVYDLATKGNQVNNIGDVVPNGMDKIDPTKWIWNASQYVSKKLDDTTNLTSKLGENIFNNTQFLNKQSNDISTFISNGYNKSLRFVNQSFTTTITKASNFFDSKFGADSDFGKMFTSLADSLSNAWGSFKSGASALYQGVKNSQAGQAVSSGYNAVSSGVSSTWGSISEYAKKQKDALWEALGQKNLTPQQKQMVMARTDVETGGFKNGQESLNYSPEQLLKTFNKNSVRITPQQAQMYGRGNGHAANQEALANIVYAHSNGNNQAGDGYKYRGRGTIQLTGRGNYAEASKAVGVDLVNNPDLAADPKYSGKIAAWYSTRGRAGKALASGNAVAYSQAVNGGTNGQQEYLKNLNKNYNTPATTATKAVPSSTVKDLLPKPSVVTTKAVTPNAISANVTKSPVAYTKELSGIETKSLTDAMTQNNPQYASYYDQSTVPTKTVDTANPVLPSTDIASVVPTKTGTPLSDAETKLSSSKVTAQLAQNDTMSNAVGQNIANVVAPTSSNSTVINNYAPISGFVWATPFGAV